MNIRQHLDDLISQALARTSGITDCQALVAPAKSAQFGDYQANGVMGLASGSSMMMAYDFAPLTADHAMRGEAPS